jgi:hypothetical protein
VPQHPSQAKAARNQVPVETLAWYDRLVATIPGVERKGATVPYTAWQGHMFSYLARDGTLALRLPAEARAEFLQRYQTRLCEAYGVVQKEYVVVPADVLQRTQELAPYFQVSFAYVGALRPKPSKRRTSS